MQRAGSEAVSLAPVKGETWQQLVEDVVMSPEVMAGFASLLESRFPVIDI
jgi:hypothetical protein